MGELLGALEHDVAVRWALGTVGGHHPAALDAADVSPAQPEDVGHTLVCGHGVEPRPHSLEEGALRFGALVEQVKQEEPAGLRFDHAHLGRVGSRRSCSQSC